MAFICIVCRELITASADSAGRNIEIVATKCGHLHHTECLEKWFNNSEFPRLECPYCKERLVRAELRRIFPSGDEETDEINKRLQDAEVQHCANQQLQEEIDEKVGQLVDIQTKYENENVLHELLRFEHCMTIKNAKEKIKSKLLQVQIKAEGEKQMLMDAHQAQIEQMLKDAEEKQKLYDDNEAKLQQIQKDGEELKQLLLEGTKAKIQQIQKDADEINRVLMTKIEHLQKKYVKVQEEKETLMPVVKVESKELSMPEIERNQQIEPMDKDGEEDKENVLGDEEIKIKEEMEIIQKDPEPDGSDGGSLERDLNNFFNSLLENPH